MSTNFHTPITTGAAANASVINAPLSALDTAITTSLTSALEVTEARGGYSSLDARLDGLVLAGSTTATMANGAANAGQKVVTVDSTTGFLDGAPVAYTLVGGVIETNTIDTVDSSTQITLDTNIGTGGIANDTYIAVIAPGALVSTGAVVGATAMDQHFNQGVFIGTNSPVVGGGTNGVTVGCAAVNPLASGGSHAVRDESTYYYAAGGYASYDSIPTCGGAGGMNHIKSFQSRPAYNGSGTLDGLYGFDFKPTITGPVTNCYAIYIQQPILSGAGDIDGLHSAIYIDELSGGDLGNYALFVAGNNQCVLNGGAQFGGNCATGAVYNPTFTSAVTDAYGFKVANPGVSGGGSVTNVYGVFVSTLSRGGSSNYAIYVEGANTVYLGGDLRIEGALDHNGTTVGFYGTAPIAKQTGVAVSAAGIHAALVNLGLIAA